MIHRIAPDCHFLPLELREDHDSTSNQSKISYYIWSPYNQRHDPA